MFLISAAAAAAIRQAYEVDGDLGALAALCIEFPEIVDVDTALLCARMIAGWKPFGRGRVARLCSVRLARVSESAKQVTARLSLGSPGSENADGLVARG
jgi:hypothetical protein